MALGNYVFPNIANVPAPSGPIRDYLLSAACHSYDGWHAAPSGKDLQKRSSQALTNLSVALILNHGLLQRVATSAFHPLDFRGACYKRSDLPIVVEFGTP